MRTLDTRVRLLEATESEFAKPPSEMTNAELVAGVLREVMGRQPTSAEVAHWLALPPTELLDWVRQTETQHGTA